MSFHDLIVHFFLCSVIFHQQDVPQFIYFDLVFIEQISFCPISGPPISLVYMIIKRLKQNDK